ncbi:MAG: HdeD family acid-resistance protein [Acidisphaera sp.]|nr:HdeD family acid-resistance protein [Acidisphaera sp.]
MLAYNWWAVALRGVFAILFGLVALFLPGVTIASLVLLFAVYMLVDGLFAIVSAARAAAHHQRWGLLILEGVVDIIAGAVAFVLPAVTVFVFVTLLGAWAVVSGIAMTIAAFRLHLTHGRWLLLLCGLISVVWGLLLFMFPVAGAVVLTWWLGGYAFAFGIVLLVLSFRLRSRHIEPQAGAFG